MTVTATDGKTYTRTGASTNDIWTFSSWVNVITSADIASTTTAGIVKVNDANGIFINTNAKELYIVEAGSSAVKNGVSIYRPIVPYRQHESVFYGLAKAAGDTTQSQSDNAVGNYTDNAKTAIKAMLSIADPTVNDVTIDGTSIVNENGEAVIPKAGTDSYGVVRTNSSYGISLIGTRPQLTTVPALSIEIKEGNQQYRPIAPNRQHESTFYGLAKAAGDTTQSASDNAVGTYTLEAKAAIRSMLGISNEAVPYELTEEDKSDISDAVYESLVNTVTVSGTDPTITAEENTRYICGELLSLNFTPCQSGICDIRFTSGSTLTVLTLPSTVKLPDWFEVETNRTYEISIIDGAYGTVTSWSI